APEPQVADSQRHFHRRPDLVGEDEQGQVIGPEPFGPAFQAVDVVARGPRLPDAARSVFRSAGEAPALDIDDESSAGAVDDEIKALHGFVVEGGAVGFVDGYIPEPPGPQIALESRFVVVAAVHGSGGGKWDSCDLWDLRDS